MAPLQEKKEKEQFFESLYQLDEYVSERENDIESPVLSRKQRGQKLKETVEAQTDLLPQTEYRDMVRSQTKRKSYEEGSKSVPIEIIGEPQRGASSVPKPTLTKKRKTEARPKNITGPSPMIAQPKDGSNLVRRNVTDMSNLKERKKQVKKSMKLKPVPLEKQYLKGFVFYFFPNNDDCPIRRLRVHKAVCYGAVWAHEWYDDVSHIIVEDGHSVTDVAKSFPSGRVPKCPAMVTDLWLIETFSSRQPRDVNWKRYLIPGFESLQIQPVDAFGESTTSNPNRECMPPRPISQRHKGDTTPSKSPLGHEPGPGHEAADSEDELDSAIREMQDLGDLQLVPSFNSASESLSDEDEDPGFDIMPSKNKLRKENAGFQCMQKHDGTTNTENPNARTIDQLQKLATIYDRKGDNWRTTAFRKAIGALRKHGELVRTKEQAMIMPGIGKSIASLIEEYVSQDRIRRLEEAQKDPRDRTLQLFLGIYGVGFQTASTWYSQGHRTLDDLRLGVRLTPNQLVGIDHYDDFQQRIPRDIVAQHAAIVKKALRATDKGLQILVGGSYRRGKADCGDIDCIITKENAGMDHIRTLMMESVIPKLKAQGFLKVALATGHSHEPGSKWHGASALPGSEIWRRLDLLFVPWAELGAALIYFTGNDLFNRSIRLLAGRKGMRLNQHGLYKDVMRGSKRERITTGTLVEGSSEKRIFDILGVPYRKPEERQIG
ncbi:hypothetical protein LTR41_001413 [Exophiala xenobiotica]|nr:hypothetical protein LTR41_001413 [Exophiala xenobiotica]KAK5317433.1 hypothetical protein LTR93_008644 [Exophiala xenobiotica]KAK5401780.1 hypothetical protein LTR06_010887 [Exophiala xenobiotica]